MKTEQKNIIDAKLTEALYALNEIKGLSQEHVFYLNHGKLDELLSRVLAFRSELWTRE